MLRWLACRGVNANDDYANFGPGNVNEGEANSYNDLFNSNGNENDNALGVCPVASINWGYAVINCMRDNIETDMCPLVL